MEKEIKIFTDGASRKNPGPAGWASIIFLGNEVKEIAGRENIATNNQMEMTAVLKALLEPKVKKFNGAVIIYSDSAYTINGITKWVYGWQKNNWMTQAKTPVENKELWQKLFSITSEYGDRLIFKKVKGHSGDKYNERADELATSFALGEEKKLFHDSLSEYQTFLNNMEINDKSNKKKTTSKNNTSSKTAYSYVSLVDGVVLTHSKWADCEKRVKGKKGAKYKKVFSKEEETDLIQDYTLSSLL